MTGDAGQATSVRRESAAHLFIESQDWRESRSAYRFLHSAHQILAAGTPTVVLLIDDGVAAAVGARPEVTRIIDAGGRVAADRTSLVERDIAVGALSPGVEAADLGTVAPLLFDPDVRVVWH